MIKEKKKFESLLEAIEYFENNEEASYLFDFNNEAETRALEFMKTLLCRDRIANDKNYNCEGVTINNYECEDRTWDLNVFYNRSNEETFTIIMDDMYNINSYTTSETAIFNDFDTFVAYIKDVTKISLNGKKKIMDFINDISHDFSVFETKMECITTCIKHGSCTVYILFVINNKKKTIVFDDSCEKWKCLE